MRFSLFSLLALASAVLAVEPTADFDAINKPDKDEKIPAGSTYEIKWDAPAKYASANIKISLIGGADPAHLSDVGTVATGVKNSAKSYSWTVDSSLGDKATYGLVFSLESDPNIFQYSKPFHIVAGEAGNSSSTVTQTGASATKTMTLSSVTSSVTVPGNLSTSAGPKTITTQVTGGAGGAGSPTTTSTRTTPTGAGAHATAGSIVGLAGLAIAALAL